MKLEMIYDQVGEKIYHYLIIKLGSPHDAEDVLQEVFYRLMRYSFRLQFVSDLQLFVFKMARNEANRFLMNKIKNRQFNQKKAELHEVIRNVISGPNPEDEDAVSKALAQLPKDQQEVIVLKFFEELTFKEIAEVCQIPLHTAASRYRYGMKKMRSMMGGES
jgi:RNA polymerase sigma-70 factor (ECF subfamily)